jgi:hypothetical protein
MLIKKRSRSREALADCDRDQAEKRKRYQIGGHSERSFRLIVKSRARQTAVGAIISGANPILVRGPRARAIVARCLPARSRVPAVRKSC